VTDLLDLHVERPVAGGRMLARHDGHIVFVSGAIPGERVRVRVGRASRQSLWAETVEVIDPSPDRREPPCDPACGGLAFAHIRYDRQRTLKGQILADAFRRLARSPSDAPHVAGSPEVAYRLRGGCTCATAAWDSSGREATFCATPPPRASSCRRRSRRRRASPADWFARRDQAGVVPESRDRAAHLELRDQQVDDARQLLPSGPDCRLTGLSTLLRG
jgi:predicted RNA-binding protein with TRAM domain